MKIIDIIISLICGVTIGFLFSDFLKEGGVYFGWYQFLIIWILFPLFSVGCLWISYVIGKRFLFVFQGSKFLLVGAFATVIDLQIFEILIWLFGPIPLISKGISFLFATLLKFLGNKYWAFREYKKTMNDNNSLEEIIKGLGKEMGQFFFVTLIGLIIDLVFFYYFTKILGPQAGISYIIWLKLSVIFSGLAAALWNFLGYKFIVFNKSNNFYKKWKII